MFKEILIVFMRIAGKLQTVRVLIRLMKIFAVFYGVNKKKCGKNACR